MKPQYGHEVAESFYLWLDNYVLSYGSGFKNESGVMFPQKSRINGKKFYSSPAAQFVSDASVSGAAIPSGINIGSAFIPRGVSGVNIDFMNGGVFCDIPDVAPTISYAKKDFNVYLSNQYDTKIFLDKAYNGAQIYKEPNASPQSSYVAPCILISQNPVENSPFAIGGTDKTTVEFNVIAVTNSYYDIIGLSSLLADSHDICFTKINFGDSPYNIYGDFKSGVYNYNTLVDSYDDYNRNMFIKSVRAKPISSTENKNNNNSFICMIHFKLEDIRTVLGENGNGHHGHT
jgi:hypothetical protein